MVGREWCAGRNRGRGAAHRLAHWRETRRWCRSGRGDALGYESIKAGERSGRLLRQLGVSRLLLDARPEASGVLRLALVGVNRAEVIECRGIIGIPREEPFGGNAGLVPQAELAVGEREIQVGLPMVGCKRENALVGGGSLGKLMGVLFETGQLEQQRGVGWGSVHLLTERHQLRVEGRVHVCRRRGSVGRYHWCGGEGGSRWRRALTSQEEDHNECCEPYDESEELNTRGTKHGGVEVVGFGLLIMATLLYTGYPPWWITGLDPCVAKGDGHADVNEQDERHYNGEGKVKGVPVAKQAAKGLEEHALLRQATVLVSEIE